MNATAQAPVPVRCDREILAPEQWIQIRSALKLSLRELEITQHIFDDNKTEYIAFELGISIHTVNTYLQRLYVKLNVRSRSQLVLRILKTYIDSLPHSYPLNASNCYELKKTGDVVSISDKKIQDLCFTRA